jgi:hypothetical protein
MTDYSIDALSTAENLKDSGFSESQAEAITVTARETQQQNLDVLITKGDLRNVEAGLKSDLENLEARLSEKITLLQWMLDIIIAAEVLPFFFYKAV